MSQDIDIIDYKILLDNINDCVCMVSSDATLLYANKKTIALSGYTADEIIGKHVIDLFHPGEQQKIITYLKKRLAGEPVPDRYNSVFMTKQGSPFPAEITANIVNWCDQKVDIIVFRDISGRISVEEALRESEKKYNFIVDNLPFVIWTSDAEGNTIFISEHVEDIYGYLPQEIYEHGEELWFGRIHPDDKHMVIASFREMLHSNSTYDIEYRIQRKDGEWIWLHDRALSQIDKTGVRYAYGIFSDVTSRRNMEMSLVEEHRKFNAIINNSFQLTGLLKPDGILIEINETALQLIGVTRDDVLGKSFQETPWWTHSMRAKIDVQSAIENAAKGTTTHFTTTHIDTNGTEHIVEVSMKPVFDEHDNVIFIVPEGRIITDFINAQDELYKAKALLTAALDQSPTGIVIADAPDLKVSFVNKAALDIFGKPYISPDTIPAHIHPANWQMFHPDGSQFEQDEHPLYETVLFGKTIHSIEAVIRRSDGDDRWILANASPIRNQQDEIAGGIVIFTDITERKKTEKELLQTREHLEIALDTANLYVFFYNISNNTIKWNFKWFHDFGFENNDIENVDVWIKHVHPDDRDELSRKMADLLSDKAPFVDHEYRFRTPSGEYRWLHVWGKIIERDNQGHPIQASGITMDITDRKKADEVLHESQDRLLQALDAAGLSQWTYYVDKDLLVDEFSLNLYGENRLLLHEHISHIHPDDRAEFTEKAQKVIAGIDQVYISEHRLMKNPDEEVWIYAKGKPVEYDRNGKPLKVTGFTMDITDRKKAEMERKELESQLRQAQKMEAIGTLAGGIAHDFNNILTVILGNLELMKFVQQEQDCEIDDSINDTLQAANRAKDLVSQILTFSRKSNVDKLPMDIGPICKETLKLLRSSTPTTIDIKQNIQNNLPRVVADPTHIHQIIMNLCTNALHAMKDQSGTITVSLDVCYAIPKQIAAEKTTQSNKLHICLKITDTGTGIQNDVIDQIFLPYYTTKPQGEGTGLGLAVVHGIVKDIGGDISVQSVIGKGTTFTVVLPALDYEETQTSIQKNVIQKGNGRILIIDDEPQIVRILEKILKKLGYESVAANDGDSALKILNDTSNMIDLVITDYTMPKQTGIELTSKIRTIHRDLPVVLMTGLQSPLMEQKATDAGIQVIVKKPISIEKIAEVLQITINKA